MVTFTTRLDGEEAPGQDWTWSGIPADTGANCTVGSTPTNCRRVMHAPGTGTMEAKVRLADGSLQQAQGVSVTVKPRRILKLDALPGTSVLEGDTLDFEVSATGGATPTNVVWGSPMPFGAGARRGATVAPRLSSLMSSRSQRSWMTPFRRVRWS
jgi:hypothetical protein